ncbi:hypothetical protein IWX90DRAFT_294827 [Phyllosticta citrichinensis]|uniref:Uncharacterized protein n=1 Tax=Phyllosticta citrichinensis TaxID=1130410 RepID=A0ABR1XKH7_9PEZI
MPRLASPANQSEAICISLMPCRRRPSVSSPPPCWCRVQRRHRSNSLDVFERTTARHRPLQVAISRTSDHPQGVGHGACGVGVTSQGQCHRSRSLLPTRPQLPSSSTPEPLVPPKYLQVTVAADAAPSLPHSPRSQHEGPTAPHSSWISCKSTVWTPSLASDAFSTWPGVAGLDAWLIRILPGRRGYPSSTRDRWFEHLGCVLSFGCPLVLACTDV